MLVDKLINQIPAPNCIDTEQWYSLLTYWASPNPDNRKLADVLARQIYPLGRLKNTHYLHWWWVDFIKSISGAQVCVDGTIATKWMQCGIRKVLFKYAMRIRFGVCLLETIEANKNTICYCNKYGDYVGLCELFEYSKLIFDTGRNKETSNGVKPKMSGIYCDHFVDNKTEYYRVINLADKSVLIQKELSQNAKGRQFLACFFAIVRAIKYCIENKIDVVVYSQNKLAIDWIKNLDAYRSHISIEYKIEWEAALKYIKSLPKLPMLVKWQKSIWGEINL